MAKCTKTDCECKSLKNKIFTAPLGKLTKNMRVYTSQKDRPFYFNNGIVQKVFKLLLTDFDTLFGKNSAFSIFAAEAGFYYLANFYYSCQQLELILSRKPSIPLRQRVYNLYRIINIGLETLNFEKDPDRIIAAINYVDYYYSFITRLENTADLTVQFWNALLSDKPSAQTLNEIGRKLFVAKLKLMKCVNFISSLSSNQIDFLVHYGLFMKYVMQDSNSADIIFKRICNANESSENMVAFENKFSLFRQGASVMLITASLDRNGNANVTKINSIVERTFGISHDNLSSFNITNLMPSNLASIHAKLIQEFFSNMTEKYVNLQKLRMVKRKDGLFVPCETVLKIVPRLSDGLQVSMFLIGDRTAAIYTKCRPAKCRKEACILICDEEHKIVGVSKDFADYLKLSEHGITNLCRGNNVFDLIPQLSNKVLYNQLSKKEGGIIALSEADILSKSEFENETLVIENNEKMQRSRNNLNSIKTYKLFWCRIVSEEYGKQIKSILVILSEIPQKNIYMFNNDPKIEGLVKVEFAYESEVCVLQNTQIQNQSETHRSMDPTISEFSMAASTIFQEKSVSNSTDKISNTDSNKFANSLRLKNLVKNKTPAYIIRLYFVIIALLIIISSIIGIFI